MLEVDLAEKLLVLAHENTYSTVLIIILLHNFGSMSVFHDLLHENEALCGDIRRISPDTSEATELIRRGLVQSLAS